MKKYILAIVYLIYSICVLSQSQDQNYIKTRTMVDETDQNKYLDVIEYFDGLGRLTQTVQVGITPAHNSLVTLQEYDMYGRECATWLPAIIMGNNGNFTNVTDLKSSAITSYGNDSNPYSKTIYEASPLNRVLEQYGPGANWHSSNSSNKVSYLTNDAIGNRSCMYFKIDGSGLNASLVKSGLYAAGELYVTEKKNEIGNLSYEFKNSLEQTILIRQMNNNEAHDTYYVYDDFGNLNYVIPPILADKIIKENKSMADNSLEVKQYAYLYKYDERNRCIRKRLPGCDWIYYVYDRTDRLIFTQDGESRKKHEWIYSIPDALGRIVQTGTCRNTDISNENYKDKLVIGTYNVEKGYSFSDFIPENRRYFMNNYYDNYDFLTDRNKELVYEDRPGYGKRYNVNDYSAKGLLTGTYVNTIPAGWEGALDEHSALYYDDRGRLIQSRKSRMSGEAFDNEYLAYNFQGQPVKRLHEHLMTDINQTSELYSYEYDHAGRLIETRHKLNEGNEVVIARNTYDELGRLISEQANGQEGLQTDYSYNIRSWTTNLNNSVYRESIEYNNIGNVIYMNEYRHSKRPQYYWEVSMEYDDLSRMTSYADAGYGAAPTTFFEYDKHGNIIYIDRSGVTAEDSYDSCDELTITHSGNQVQSVVDATDCSETYYSYDFRNLTGVGTSASYEYDLNGAVTKDPYKGATIINNSLNLPQQITVNNNLASGSITYVYLATGEKIMASSSVSLRRSLNPAEIAGGVSTMASTDRDEATFYFGNIIYKTTPEGEPYLDKILIDNGYIKDGEYYFYIKDHLGNNRATAFSTGSVKGMDDYFPYGMPVIDSKWGKNPQAYRFGGKELERLMGLNLYDFQARWHDPALGRFMSVDPLCEKYYSISPYAYCANNPINAIDPTGLDYYYTIDGKYLGRDEKETQYVYAVENNAYRKTDNGYNIAIPGMVQIMDNQGNGMLHGDFLSLAGTLYAEGASTWEEAAGIYSVMENRANSDNKTTSEIASGGGIYGYGERHKINDEKADPMQVRNAYKGLIRGSLDAIDYSGGGYFWHGKDFGLRSWAANKNFYQVGFEFTNTKHDLWKQGNHLSGNKLWNYKYESTGAAGNTIFMKLTTAWQKATGGRHWDGRTK